MAIAVVFPGQGSQYAGMVASFQNVQCVRRLFAEASDLLGEDLWSLVQNGPEEKLMQTLYTQPALFVTDLSFWTVWCEQGGCCPDFFIGHSLGEYAALVASGVVSFTEGLRLVQHRARMMTRSVLGSVGAMAALIGLSAADVCAVCAEVAAENNESRVVEAVNFNAPQQTVIAGHEDAVHEVCVRAKIRGAKRCVVLPVSAAFHSSLMKPAALGMAQYLQICALSPPTIAVVHNYDAQCHQNVDDVRRVLAAQIDHPVQWMQSLHYLVSCGVETFIESGPGAVLSALIKKNVPAACMHTLRDYDTLCRVVGTCH